MAERHEYGRHYCGHCGVEIVWARTLDGDLVPLDRLSARRFVHIGQTPAFGAGMAHLVDTFANHRDTCSAPEMWRSDHG